MASPGLQLQAAKAKQPPAPAPAATTTNLPPGTVADPSDPTGFRVVDQAAYSAWHQSSLGAKGNETNYQTSQNNANAAQLQASQDAAKQQTVANQAKIDTSGQFNPGMTRVPTVAESLAGGQAASPGLGSAGYAGLTKSPLGVSSSRPAPTVAGTVGIDMGGGVVRNPSKVQTAADQATDALGPAPQVDQGLADRRLGEYQEALGMSREVIDRLLNGPNTADRIGSQVLRTQLALARSARGGPGAVQQAMAQAQQQAPELQAAAQQQATAEELQRVTAAGNVASNFAQAALGARGQDVDIAKKNTDAGLAVKNMVANLTGTQLELDQRNQELLGQMARDMAAMDFDWAQLTAQQQDAALDRYLQQYGIDANIAAQIKLAKQSGKMGLKDWINAGVGVLGAAAGIGAAAAGKK